jgi:hypothetical protein
MNTYLCGPINGCTDNECKDWRQLASELLDGEVYDPMVRDYRGRELDPGIAKEIVENDKSDIDSCHYILVNYVKPSVGTSMEILYAWERFKTIIVVNSSNQVLSPWLIYHSSVQFGTIEEACEWIKSDKENA